MLYNMWEKNRPSMMEVPIIQKPVVHWFAEQIKGLISIQERATSLKHERVNALLFACILTEIYSLIMRKQLTSMHPNIKRGCFN